MNGNMFQHQSSHNRRAHQNKRPAEIHYIVEPNIKEHTVFKLTDYMEAVENADIVVFLVAHDEFKTIEISKEKQVLDFCGVYK